MGVLQGDRLLISTNATLNPHGKSGGGPARPGLWEAMPSNGFGAPAISQPGWRAQAGPFTEHSYRSLAVDGQRGEVFVMQNVGNSHAEWAFRDDRGAWSAQGRLDWPIDTVAVIADQRGPMDFPCHRWQASAGSWMAVSR